MNRDGVNEEQLDSVLGRVVGPSESVSVLVGAMGHTRHVDGRLFECLWEHRPISVHLLPLRVDQLSQLLTRSLLTHPLLLHVRRDCIRRFTPLQLSLQSSSIYIFGVIYYILWYYIMPPPPGWLVN